MKKLMIAASAIVLAVAADAATVSWSSGVNFKPTSATDGTFVTGLPNRVDPSGFYVWVLGTDAAAKTAFDAVNLSTVYDTYYMDTTKRAQAKSGSISGFSGTYKSDDIYGAGANVYAVIVTTYTDATGNDWYIANKASGTIGSVSETGDPITIGNLSSKVGGVGGTWGGTENITAWTAAAAVPEPTSGLLLLLGVAGLALRRRRA